MTETFKLLDLFCGAGGAAMGYHKALEEAGIPHTITGIDINPMPSYPFEFIQADALEYVQEHGDEYDFIHASPPCQRYGRMNNIHHAQDKHPDLVAFTRDLLTPPYVIENVIGAPVRTDYTLCGTMFGLRIIRHRLFEVTWQAGLTPTCNHADVFDPWHGPNRTADKFREAMGINWMPVGGGRNKHGSIDEAIPPAYTRFIMRQYLENKR
jgi:hypothetical protein